MRGLELAASQLFQTAVSVAATLQMQGFDQPAFLIIRCLGLQYLRHKVLDVIFFELSVHRRLYARSCIFSDLLDSREIVACVVL